VWKHFPLEFHKNAPLAHLASIAAAKQGKFWEYRDAVFADQKNLTRDNLLSHARRLGLDLKRFEADLVDVDTANAMQSDMNEVKAIGVTGTPGFFINGRFLSGAKPFEEFAKKINAELRAKGLPVPAEVAEL
jgi:predicted DsbA family dithiol-disulfide isomerase